MTTKITSNNISNSGVNSGNYINPILTINSSGIITTSTVGYLIPVLSDPVILADANWNPVEDTTANTITARLIITGTNFSSSGTVAQISKNTTDNTIITAASTTFLTYTILLSQTAQANANTLIFSNTSNLSIGMEVYGNANIPSETIITSINGNQITISKNLLSAINSGQNITFRNTDKLASIFNNVSSGTYHLTLINATGARATKINYVTFA
jgi:hypothetical protein